MSKSIAIVLNVCVVQLLVVDVAFVEYKTVALQILILKCDDWSKVDQTDCIIYSIALLFGYDVYKKSLRYLAHGKLKQHADTKVGHLENGVHIKQRTFYYIKNLK